MSRIFRRLASTASGPSASEAAKEILQRYGNKPVSVREQLLDANHVRLLSTTFGRQNVHEKASLDADGAPVEGTPLPPGYHFIYFTPTFQEQSLGIDGTDKTLNPLSPWTRRMWAGGSMEWTQDPKRILRIGQKVKETTQITSAEEKKMKSGDSMVLAGLEKTFENEHGVALVDKRNWVFQKEMTAKKEPPPKPEEKPLPEGTISRDFCPTDVTLFRLSALTFNAHKIHYSLPWCRDVEGHPSLVVHGPYALLGMLDLYRDTQTKGDPESLPKSISYRAMSPLYVNETFRVILEQDPESKGKWTVQSHDSFGKVASKGTITE